MLRFDFVPAQMSAALAFALRNWLAFMLALYLAFFLQLDQPYWAGMTVWIVAQPTLGMVISRSLYRVIGTLIGTAMGVALIALFSQSPEMFILALALWIGLCTLASNLLRGFRSYGAVLAGYSAAIVSLGAFNNPNQEFYVAMNRGSATLIGIASATLVASLFARHEAREKVISQMQGALRACAVRGAFPITGTFQDRTALDGSLTVDLIDLDTEIDYASAESADFRIHDDLARSLLAHLFGAISAKRSLEGHLLRIGMVQDQNTVSFYQDAMTLLERAPHSMEENRWEDLEEGIGGLRRQLGEHKPETAEADVSQIISSRVVLDRLDELMLHFGRAIHDWRGLQGGWKWKPSLRLNFHRDHRTAVINGMRSLLAVLAAGAFWIASAWSSGSTMLIFAGMGCSLFSTAPHPESTLGAWIRGAILAAAAAFVCNFYFLEQVDGFVRLSLVYGLFLVPGGMAIFLPRTRVLAASYCMHFVVFSRPLNLMDYDVTAFLNNALAIIMGTVFAMLSYRLFLPPNPQAAHRHVVYRIRHGLQTISQRNPIPPAWAWQTRMFDRVNRIYESPNPSGTRTDAWYEGGLGALDLGNDVLRLRRLVEEEKVGDEVSSLLRSVLKSFDEIATNPHSTRFRIQASNAALQVKHPPENQGGRLAWYRSVGVVGEMEVFFIEHPDFFKVS